MTEPPILTVEGLNVLYGDYQVLWDVSLQVGQGEIVLDLRQQRLGDEIHRSLRLVCHLAGVADREEEVGGGRHGGPRLQRPCPGRAGAGGLGLRLRHPVPPPVL